ncbi:hypothetical protein CALCODRAFT_354229 [Calocera cornea HHB12733]|uniref:Uncharacterized protein n=1 Tax=Calocera cornea HHB12733 TaxID=1353952 RepID=A0A165EQW6_9BASI|nr:hypothetical protein CALCODRAFT_354229 [Calocera cornea HHB12733]
MIRNGSIRPSPTLHSPGYTIIVHGHDEPTCGKDEGLYCIQSSTRGKGAGCTVRQDTEPGCSCSSVGRGIGSSHEGMFRDPASCSDVSYGQEGTRWSPLPWDLVHLPALPCADNAFPWSHLKDPGSQICPSFGLTSPLISHTEPDSWGSMLVVAGEMAPDHECFGAFRKSQT